VTFASSCFPIFIYQLLFFVNSSEGIPLFQGADECFADSGEDTNVSDRNLWATRACPSDLNSYIEVLLHLHLFYSSFSFHGGALPTRMQFLQTSAAKTCVVLCS